MNEACNEIDRILNSRNSLADWSKRICYWIVTGSMAYLAWHLVRWALK